MSEPKVETTFNLEASELEFNTTDIVEGQIINTGWITSTGWTTTLESNYQSVGEFHKKFGLPAAVSCGGDQEIRGLDDSTFEFRSKFMDEELTEFVLAFEDGDLPGMADALVDLVYVALGTAHLMGLPFDELFAEVQQANMAKVRASSKDDTRSKRKHSLDVVKPEGWTAPDIEGILRRHGWSG